MTEKANRGKGKEAKKRKIDKHHREKYKPEREKDRNIYKRRKTPGRK